jgi:hypothetical protein
VTSRMAQVGVRIRDELGELARVLERAQSAWSRAQAESDDLFLDSLALNLHALYTGYERLFELIGSTVDGCVPQGSNWHQLLLEQMSQEVPGVRPAVISRGTRVKLDDYRGFRHIVRNIYAFRFDPRKLGTLIEQAPATFSQAQAELTAFAEFLERSIPE